jgi:hypothetical protein
VSDEAAAFTPLAAIGLQGIRLAAPQIGERVAVLGLGLIGLMTVQMLRANGCRVLGADFDRGRLDLARQLGADMLVDLSAGEDPVAAAMAFSRGHGVDAVLITASAKSNEPVSQAARMSRKRGRIVLVGVTGLSLNRAEFYEKELTLQVSCSYGPGRYDPEYEERGRDYPFGFVRWTEQRNFEAVLDLMACGTLDVAPLISHRLTIDAAQQAYDALAGSQALGVLLTYPNRPVEAKLARVTALDAVGRRPAAGRTVSVIGAGNYASRMLIPALKQAGAVLKTLASQGGVSAVIHGRKNGFANAATDLDPIFTDPETDAIVVATRHDSHAALAQRALQSGKAVFVEKPLALSEDQLSGVVDAYEASINAGGSPLLMVGFNRRFAPLAVKMKAMLDTLAEPKTFIVTVNAGAIPLGNWTQDAQVGGGRIVGEACHFIDMLRWMAGAPITGLQSVRVGGADGGHDVRATLVLTFEDGSHGTIRSLGKAFEPFAK